MKNYPFAILLILFFITSASRCKKECQDPTNPQCENYDACYGKKDISAAFVIEELVNGRGFECDTIGSIARFTALGEADSYTWYLGTEVIKEKSFTRLGFPKDRWLSVKLVVEKKRDACFPNSSEKDSLVKSFYVWPPIITNNGSYYILINPYPIYGTYSGSLKSKPSLVFNASLLDTNWVDSANFPSTVGIMRGIPYPPNYGTDKITLDIGFGELCDVISPKALHISCQGYKGIPAMKGYAWLDKNDAKSITIAYSFKDTLTGVWASDTFRGRKIY